MSVLASALGMASKLTQIAKTFAEEPFSPDMSASGLEFAIMARVGGPGRERRLN